MKRLRGGIAGIEADVVTGWLERSGARKHPLELALILDDVPFGLATPAGNGARAEFRFVLPSHRIAATLDIADPASGRSILDRAFDLSGHYNLSIEQFALHGAVVKGRFSIAKRLDEFLSVQILQDGWPAPLVFARRDGERPGAFLYGFEAPLRCLCALDRKTLISGRIAGAELPSASRLSVGPKDIGCAGYVESAEGGTIRGWAADLGGPGKRVRIDLLADDAIIATTAADEFRKDVHAVGFGDGKVGFSFTIPPVRPVRADAPAPVLSVVLAGTRTHLSNSPITPGAGSSLLGFFDGMQGHIAVGWACDLDFPDTPLEVEAVCDGRVVAAGLAKHFRGDVMAAGLPISNCGFRIDLGAKFTDCLGKQISARVRDRGFVLGGSPQTVTENPNIRRFLDRATRLDQATSARLRRRLNHRARGHAVSIVMPVYNTAKLWLTGALESVRRQWCENWELICINDCSTEPHVLEILHAYAKRDRRFRVLSTDENVGIARATNFGIRAARFEYIAFMDHDDFLEPDAIYCFIKAIAETDADFLYSDEVLTHDDLNSVLEVRARPAFSYDYYLSHPYFVHMLCVRASLAQRVGGWNEAMKISADIDFVLRILEAAGSVAHVPSILYRWRTHEKSAGHARQAEVMAATKAALRRHFGRRGIAAKVSDGPWFNQFRIDWPDDDGRILIVIPTRNKGDLLRTCIESIEKTAKGVDYRIVVVDHESKEPRSRKYLERLAARHTVMPYRGKFNFARMNNLAVRKHGRGAKYCLFLNNDIEAIENGWLQRMRSLAQRADVGCVGALLLYADKRVQHAGVILGFNNAADHAMKFAESYIEGGTRRNLGYNCTLTSVREFSAVTAACMMLRKEVFESVGGFDESFAIGFNDTDLCLRVREAGLKVLYDGYTMLWHHESATRSETKQVLHPEDDRRLRKRWPRFFTEGDPFYNPNLDHDASDHALREDAGCRRLAPARLTMIDLAAATPALRKRNEAAAAPAVAAARRSTAVRTRAV